MNCCGHLYGHSYGPTCFYYSEPEPEPLASWERELLGQTPRANVEFFLKDGTSFTIEDIVLDSIGDNGENKGITAVESNKSDNTFHVPNVLYWTIHHTFDY